MSRLMKIQTERSQANVIVKAKLIIQQALTHALRAKDHFRLIRDR